MDFNQVEKELSEINIGKNEVSDKIAEPDFMDLEFKYIDEEVNCLIEIVDGINKGDYKDETNRKLLIYYADDTRRIIPEVYKLILKQLDIIEGNGDTYKTLTDKEIYRKEKNFNIFNSVFENFLVKFMENKPVHQLVSEEITKYRKIIKERLESFKYEWF